MPVRLMNLQMMPQSHSNRLIGRPGSQEVPPSPRINSSRAIYSHLHSPGVALNLYVARGIRRRERHWTSGFAQEGVVEGSHGQRHKVRHDEIAEPVAQSTSNHRVSQQKGGSWTSPDAPDRLFRESLPPSSLSLTHARTRTRTHTHTHTHLDRLVSSCARLWRNAASSSILRRHCRSDNILPLHTPVSNMTLATPFGNHRHDTRGPSSRTRPKGTARSKEPLETILL